MDSLVQLRQRAEAQNKVIDVSCINLATGAGARIVSRPTRGNKEGVLLAQSMEQIQEAKPLFGL